MNLNKGKEEYLYEECETPVLGEAECEALRLLAEKDDTTDSTRDSDSAITKPAPRSLIIYFANQSRQVLQEHNLSDDMLAEQVITVLDPLISSNASAQSIYNALHDEMNRTTNLDVQEKMWNISTLCLESVIEETVRQLMKKHQKSEDDSNLLAVEGYLRSCWEKVISPRLRVSMINIVKECIFEIADEKQKKSFFDAFVLSMINSLNNQEGNLDLHVSEDTRAAFKYNGKSFAPDEQFCTPEVFRFSYPDSGGGVYASLMKCNEEPQVVVQEALDLLKQTQDLQIIPNNLGSLNMEAFERLCKKYYIMHINLLRKTKSKKLKNIISVMWNRVIGPQLMMLGELRFSKTFFLPSPAEL